MSVSSGIIISECNSNGTDILNFKTLSRLVFKDVVLKSSSAFDHKSWMKIKEGDIIEAPEENIFAIFWLLPLSPMGNDEVG